jgi:hypothetical protein
LLQDTFEPELLRRKNVSHASDRVRGNGAGRTHRGEAFTIRPVIVGKHPKKIFGVHKTSFDETRCDRDRQARCDWLRKNDTMTDAR